MPAKPLALVAFTLCILVSTALAVDPDTMCVKQKDGTYKCTASGKIEKTPRRLQSCFADCEREHSDIAPSVTWR